MMKNLLMGLMIAGTVCTGTQVMGAALSPGERAKIIFDQKIANYAVLIAAKPADVREVLMVNYVAKLRLEMADRLTPNKVIDHVARYSPGPGVSRSPGCSPLNPSRGSTSTSASPSPSLFGVGGEFGTFVLVPYHDGDGAGVGSADAAGDDSKK